MFEKQFVQEVAAEVAALVIAKIQPMKAAPRYMTVAQAAEYIGHTKRSFEYLMTKNLFPVICHDRLVSIDRLDFDQFMMNSKT